ncbi:MAG: hypothetical protein OMM_05403 [Candidatus Magnetoglobus multicellularis str. Araruama]|uniref:PD-(D/E)XK endonuclease-like domain-containing protein n=1 Tax=Candidatus Magnetoglobus multicellularis str. Araruama TaxID=890399 RepID=A0A1V1NWJ9_9BACT|nr:MAG: hypothetical protein OMM_05403 [Candidatus Magnetoglobus multicellularis str. Araruama]
MKYINDKDYSREMKAFLTYEWYDGKGDDNVLCSVTDLFTPPKIYTLKEKHKDEIEIPLSRMEASQEGSAFHDTMQKILWEKFPHEYITEARLTTEFNDKTISGKFDAYHIESKTLIDFKTTWNYKISKPDTLRQWRIQLNIYARMLREQGYEVDSLEIQYVLKDKANEYKGINSRYGVIELELMSNYELERIVNELINEKLSQPMRDCTSEEQWKRNPEYAVYKTGSKRASKVLKSEAEVDLFLYGKNKEDYNVETRTFDPVRCLKWCPVKHFCDQWRANSQREEDSEDDLPFI